MAPKEKVPPDASRISDPSSIALLPKRYLVIRHPKIATVLKVQYEISASVREFLHGKGYIEILPPIVGPVTDPGIREADQASFVWYNGEPYKIMSSMILYKQMAVSSLGKIFAFSPNVRLEPVEARKTGRHLAEFWQIDVEAPRATYEDAMSLAERLLRHVCEGVKKRCVKELLELGRQLRVPSVPFRRMTHREAVEMVRSMGFEASYKEEIPWDAEEALSARFKEPFWVTDYPYGSKGFYYLPHSDKPGLLRGMDLFYPEGYGEASSGGEREYEYEQVVKRIRDGGEDPKKYGWYLEMLKTGIPPSAGFGIGLERLTRYVCGLKKIWDAHPYPKVPGVQSP